MGPGGGIRTPVVLRRVVYSHVQLSTLPPLELGRLYHLPRSKSQCIMNYMKGLNVTHLNVRQSIAVVIARLMLIEIIFAFLIFFIYIPLSQLDHTSNWFTQFFTASSLVFILILTVKMVLSFYVIFRWLNEYYEIAEDAVYHKRGFIFKQVEKCALRNARTITFTQGFIGKLLNYGTIDMFLWPMRTHFIVYMIHNPTKYFKMLEDLIASPHQEKSIMREHIAEEEEGM